MFCSQCGKKVTDEMLFCPFCGSPIVVPDQEERPEPKSVTASSEPTSEETSEAKDELSLDELPPLKRQSDALEIRWDSELPARPKAAEEFRPLDLDALEEQLAAEPEEELEAPAEEKSAPVISELLSSRLKEEPVRLQGRAPDLSNVRNPDRARPKSRKQANAYVPVKAFNPNDIFLDGGDADDDEDDYAYEEAEEGGFFLRHIRGVVGLSLFAVVLAIVMGWAISGSGQRALAGMNLAWRYEVYEEMGYEAYNAGQYAVSANYYAQALNRSTENYSLAYSAGVAYYMNGDTARAAEMGKRAVEINPSNKDGYLLLQRLYPDPAQRPWEIQSLIQQGFRMTGESALNDAPQE